MVANIFGPDLGIVVILILLMLVGGSQLPKLARNLGMAGKEFRKAHDEAMSDTPSAASVAPVSQIAPVPAPIVTQVASTVPVAQPVAQPTDQVTLSRADLEALLKERDARVQPDATS
jgi:sec-independent protein translocase protein TatA